jgi:cysteine desulfurase
VSRGSLIYLDNNATTRPFDEVIESMRRCMEDHYANPSAETSAFTGADRPSIEAASAMATLLGAEDGECFTFTSGATESNNWVFHAAGMRGAGRILISAIEHASVSGPAEAFAQRGFQVLPIPVSSFGVIDLEALESLLTEETILVSILAAHNETGAVQPVAEASQIVKARSAALFHTDATQALGKLPINLTEAWPEVDLLSFSAHKFHGPKGIGGLYIRPGVQLPPFILGGGQQLGLRSGTMNSPALAGLAAAARLSDNEGLVRTEKLRDRFERELLEAFQEAVIHAKQSLRIPNTSLISFPDLDGEELVAELAAAGIITSTGSACSAGAVGPSASLLAMGVDYTLAEGTIRISLSRLSQEFEIEALLKHLTAKRMRPSAHQS